jgi:hypothetical protein
MVPCTRGGGGWAGGYATWRTGEDARSGRLASTRPLYVPIRHTRTEWAEFLALGGIRSALSSRRRFG